MPTEILMPALSPTMEEGTLAKWLVKEGDEINPGDVIAEIETDKATMEVEAVDPGVISEILVPEGSEGVKVNAPIARVSNGDDAGEKPATENPDTKPPPANGEANVVEYNPSAPTPVFEGSAKAKGGNKRVLIDDDDDDDD